MIFPTMPASLWPLIPQALSCSPVRMGTKYQSAFAPGNSSISLMTPLTSTPAVSTLRVQIVSVNSEATHSCLTFPSLTSVSLYSLPVCRFQVLGLMANSLAFVPKRTLSSTGVCRLKSPAAHTRLVLNKTMARITTTFLIQAPPIGMAYLWTARVFRVGGWGHRSRGVRPAFADQTARDPARCGAAWGPEGGSEPGPRPPDPPSRVRRCAS